MGPKKCFFIITVAAIVFTLVMSWEFVVQNFEKISYLMMYCTMWAIIQTYLTHNKRKICPESFTFMKYYNHELDDKEIKRFQVHLKICNECSIEYKEICDWLDLIDCSKSKKPVKMPDRLKKWCEKNHL